MSAFFVLLLVITVFVGIMHVGIACTQHGSDAAGNAMSQAFGAITGGVVWIFLAVNLLIAGRCGVMPLWALAFVLVPASAVADQIALQEMSADRVLKWPAIVPILVPALLIIFAIWCYFWGAHADTDCRPIVAAIWGMIALLSILPWVVRIRRMRALAAIPKPTAEELAAEKAREEQDRRRQLCDSFNALTPDSPLWYWWNFTNDEEFKERAYVGARLVKSRQADILVILQPGQSGTFLALPDLGLALTPELLNSIKTFLVDQVNNLRPFDPQSPQPATFVTDWFARYFPVFGWIIDQKGNINDELAAMELAVCKYPDSPERQRFIENLRGFVRAE